MSDPFEFKDEPKEKRSFLPKDGVKLPSMPDLSALSGMSGTLWILGTVYFLIMAVLLFGYFGYTFINPYHNYNPWSPTNPADVPPTFTPIPPPPTNTPIPPTPTLDPAIPATPTATSVLESLNTPTPEGFLPSQTPAVVDMSSPTPPPGGGPLFVMQEGNPVYQAHSNGCGGLYVAGVVLGIDGAPRPLMLVRVQGLLAGAALGQEDALSGGATQYGPSGYEIKLADAPVDSSNIWLELWDIDSGELVSGSIVFTTFNDCNRNLVIINFVQVSQ